ncbi:tryptophan 7-halogenase [Luteolibacter yonseiensis]|uniref:Tryptophan 7-halogenase n=1 Tax=Luteolibacter yonseiensis TaxID=1144680 RepID=A0A934VAL1_9BACT|nr:FAD-dependent oxidoreductase [Luteolibacter yonseiensis]MBK1814494.1 tryptophan 7-halogenase [Luteolibacter yonseiensis]
MPAPATSDTHWDVIIIGGGPAGSTAATTLAQAGRRVLVLEKAKFPRFHIGESLLPYNRRIFDDLGVWEKIAAEGFTKKRAAQFVMGNGSRANRLDFSKGAFTKYPEAVQVERSRFDDILLHHSRENGAEVREESTVLEHRVEAGRVVIRYRAADGAEQEITAPYLIDASGLHNFTANREKLREYYPGHKKIAIFSHFSGIDMPTGEEEGDILIIRREKSWCWMIPLAPDKTSVGLVIDAADFKALGKKPQQVFDEAVADTPVIRKRFRNAEMKEELHVIVDFSYKNHTLVSPRVVRVGDSSGFIDPMFSSGVLLAMTSGQQGAQVIHEALETGNALTAGMKRYEKDNRKRIAIYWEFIENFYKNHFAQIFFQPYNRWGMVCSINAILAGCTSPPFAVRWRLRVFFLLAWLNKHVPVAKRIKIS